jgi:hypothetical protein
MGHQGKRHTIHHYFLLAFQTLTGRPSSTVLEILELSDYELPASLEVTASSLAPFDAGCKDTANILLPANRAGFPMLDDQICWSQPSVTSAPSESSQSPSISRHGSHNESSGRTPNSSPSNSSTSSSRPSVQCRYCFKTFGRPTEFKYAKTERC